MLQRPIHDNNLAIKQHDDCSMVTSSALPIIVLSHVVWHAEMHCMHACSALVQPVTSPGTTN